MNFKEQCWFIYGFKTKKYFYGFFRYQAIGTFGSVDFNWEKVISQRKMIIGFHHTHPSGVMNLSETDIKTMRSWIITLGKPLLCGIKCDGKVRFFLWERVNGSIQYKEVLAEIKHNFLKIKL